MSLIRENTITAIQQDNMVLQVERTSQKVFGREISNPNNVPPIGAPNAVAIPQERPHEMNSLLCASLWKYSKPLIGKYKTLIPIMAPR